MVVEGFCGYHRGQRQSFLAAAGESASESEQSGALSLADGPGTPIQQGQTPATSGFSLRSRATDLALRRVSVVPITEEQGVLAAEQAWSPESQEAFAFVQALFPGSGCPNSGQAEETWRRFVLEPFVCTQILDKPFPFCEQGRGVPRLVVRIAGVFDVTAAPSIPLEVQKLEYLFQLLTEEDPQDRAQDRIVEAYRSDDWEQLPDTGSASERTKPAVVATNLAAKFGTVLPRQLATTSLQHTRLLLYPRTLQVLGFFHGLEHSKLIELALESGLLNGMDTAASLDLIKTGSEGRFRRYLEAFLKDCEERFWLRGTEEALNGLGGPAFTVDEAAGGLRAMVTALRTAAREPAEAAGEPQRLLAAGVAAYGEAEVLPSRASQMFLQQEFADALGGARDGRGVTQNTGAKRGVASTASESGGGKRLREAAGTSFAGSALEHGHGRSVTQWNASGAGVGLTVWVATVGGEPAGLSVQALREQAQWQRPVPSMMGLADDPYANHGALLAKKDALFSAKAALVQGAHGMFGLDPPTLKLLYVHQHLGQTQTHVQKNVLDVSHLKQLMVAQAKTAGEQAGAYLPPTGAKVITEQIVFGQWDRFPLAKLITTTYKPIQTL